MLSRGMEDDAREIVTHIYQYRIDIFSRRHHDNHDRVLSAKLPVTLPDWGCYRWRKSISRVSQDWRSSDIHPHVVERKARYSYKIVGDAFRGKLTRWRKFSRPSHNTFHQRWHLFVIIMTEWLAYRWKHHTIRINHCLSNARIAEMRARAPNLIKKKKKLYNLRVTYPLSISPSERKYTPVPTDTVVEKIDETPCPTLPARIYIL